MLHLVGVLAEHLAQLVVDFERADHVVKQRHDRARGSSPSQSATARSAGVSLSSCTRPVGTGSLISAFG
jgi:hypothetical protein